MVWPFGRRAPPPEERNATGTATTDRVTVENWSSRDCKITITQPPGFMQRVVMHAKVDLPPHTVYDILVDPDNSRYFRTIKGVTYRRVLQDRWGTQKVEVEQAAGWRFLFLSGVFYTRLFVFQNRHQGTIRFKLARPGFMKKFEGEWRVQPFNQSTLDSMEGHRTAWSRLTSAVSNVSSLVHKPSSTLVTLEQAVQPKYVPPKAIAGYFGGISANILRGLMDDLKEEAERVKSGAPIPKHQLKKLEAAKKLKKHQLRESAPEQYTRALEGHAKGGSITCQAAKSTVIVGRRLVWIGLEND